MARISDADKWALINAIATREGTAQELARRYGRSVEFLRTFVNKHREEIEAAQIKHEQHESEVDETSLGTEPTPIDLERLWIANKTDRLNKLQNIADRLYTDCMNTFDAATLREFRSYCAAAANELGQLLHRGAGDSSSDTLNVDIQGVDFENLK